MPIKDILTVLDLAGDQPAAKYALEFGRVHDAHVTGLAVSFEPVVPAFAAAPMPVDYLQAAHDQAIAAAKDAKNQFDEFARLAGVKNESRLAEILTGGPLDNVLAHCRPTDLVVIGQSNPDKPEPMRELLIETILFESGVPVLLVPYIGSKSFEPKNVLVGWDGSSTATRAILSAIPVLEKADKVTVLVIEKKANSQAGQPGAEVANYLARHNMNVTIDVVSNPQTGVADTVLNYVTDNSNDLVVMGGYGHSRMREFLFGGATREILEAMTVPVLMAH
ncbi:universal stress protein [Roseibium alexandrii]|uniref:Universal stress protein UspA/related nucleotide-binding protein n=1 Tax=Roseibium alexandrii (strain DSM 17067 / NCIMB 14079 / DFL-11) TaxID=244592 RepID=A0A5E8H295_ROSAD|nr:universal stress protein [Roseibium alexandrii]EEE46184.1 Universal stress protein UspA/related nucleotide-binding protein [Roseibium alexandrii DFL-11]